MTLRRALTALIAAAVLTPAALVVAPATTAEPAPAPKRCHTVPSGEKFCCPQSMMVIRVRGEEGVYGCRPINDQGPPPAAPGKPKG